MMKNCKLTVTAFDWVPSFAQGHVRDLRVRWALEEAGFPYEVELLPQGTQREPRNVARQPFGQVPVIEIDGRAMFESGAIVWRIAEASETLLPPAAEDRDRALSWLFAALNSLEPSVGMIAMLDIFMQDREAAARLRPEVVELLRMRLASIAAALGAREYFLGAFTVADLMIVSVLRDVPGDMLAEFPTLAGLVQRATARPAFQAALAGQMRPFADHAPR